MTCRCTVFGADGLTHEQVAPFVAMGELALTGVHARACPSGTMAALENNCGLICPALAPEAVVGARTTTGPALSPAVHCCKSSIICAVHLILCQSYP